MKGRFCAGSLLLGLLFLNGATAQVAPSPDKIAQLTLPSLLFTFKEADRKLEEDLPSNDYFFTLVKRLEPYANQGVPVLGVLVKDDTLNAFVTPGGTMAVHEGVWQAAQTEGEFVSVLAHETSHLRLKHLFQSDTNTGQSLGAAILGAATGGLFLGIIAGLADNLSGSMKFSRIKEEEADLTGLKLMQALGYDPKESVSMMRHLLSGTQGDEYAFALDHPASSERVVYLNTLVSAKGTRPKPTPNTPLTFELSKLWLRMKNNRPKNALDPEKQAYLQSFSRVLNATRGGRCSPSNTQDAQALYAASPSPFSIALWVEALSCESPDPEAAKAALLEYLDLLPQSYYGNLRLCEILLKSGTQEDARAALERLWRIRELYPQSRRLWQLVEKSAVITRSPLELNVSRVYLSLFELDLKRANYFQNEAERLAKSGNRTAELWSFLQERPFTPNDLKSIDPSLLGPDPKEPKAP